MSSPRGTTQPSPGQEALFSLSEIPRPPSRPPAAPRPANVPDLASYDILLANLSGGKDSQTMLRAPVRAAEAAGARDRVVCVFADLGDQDEWPGTAETAARHAAWYGLRFITVCRAITDPATGARRQQGLLEHIERRGMWPDARNRYCTSDLKRGPIRTVITSWWPSNARPGSPGEPCGCSTCWACGPRNHPSGG